MTDNYYNKKLTILTVGGGGREHAIVRALSLSPRAGKLYCAPGNAGIAQLAECVPVKATDVEGIVRTAKEIKADLVFVAPDDPLMLGTVDRLEEEGIRAFGPRKNAALLEGSKVFSKGLMKKYGIPTAGYETFSDPKDALAYIKEQGVYPVVVKADGLALGKGAVIAADEKEASDALKMIMEDKTFGDSGNNVVIEEFLTGPECTVLAFTDGVHIEEMVSAQDHKRALDGDKGLNTGGMGAFSPSLFYTPEVAERCRKEIFRPTVDAMRAEGRIFKGVIYFQMMLTENGPKVIEYNARFGDPEAQVVLPRLKTDFIDIIDAVIDGTLDKVKTEWTPEAAVCVVAASGGYPAKYEKGYPISGLDEVSALPDTYVYHAGTASENGRTVTSGGRVLCVSCLGGDIADAVSKAYAGIEKIKFRNMFFRHDIAASAINAGNGETDKHREA